jgi:3alpha(or 20beta)-hydroxysteroid dehydrogenase
MRLAGKVALVTAGARGIGAAIVRRFVAEGAQVAICDVLDDAGEALAVALGERAHYIRLDVGAKSAWQAAVANTEAIFGPLNILVHDTGMGTSGISENGIDDDFSTSLLVGQASLFWGIQAALPSLRKGGRGSIVGLAPCMGTEARTGLAAYATVAYGIHGMTRAAAVELGDESIRANSVRPGLIRRAGINDDQHSGDGFGLIPLHREADADRAGQVEDVANAVLFLASDESSYVTGTEFFIDGGLSQCRNSVAGRAYDVGAPAWTAAAALA